MKTALALFSAAAFIRVLVGYHPHSGQDNYHGQRGVYGGDYEAQRHWMELTWHLPLSQWYWYDLEYWGLDYPPLTAYHIYLYIGLSHYLVGPETVANDSSSRGYEDPVHKAFYASNSSCFRSVHLRDSRVGLVETSDVQVVAYSVCFCHDATSHCSH